MTQLLLKGQAVKAHSQDVKLGVERDERRRSHQLTGLNERAKAAPPHELTSYRVQAGIAESLPWSLEVMSVTVNTSLIEMRINMFRSC